MAAHLPFAAPREVKLVGRGCGVIAVWLCRKDETIIVSPERLSKIAKMHKVAIEDLWWIIPE